MITNNILFSLRCEWNRWDSQRGKLGAILLGFSFVCMLTAISLLLGDRLFFSNPPWVQNNERFYTLSTAFEDGRQSGTSRQSIDYLSSLASVDEASWLMAKRYDIKSSEHQLNTPLAIVFDEALISLLAIPFPKNQSIEEGVWLSNRYWKETFSSDSDVVGSYLSHSRIPTGIQVKGVLPPSMDSIGPWQPDIWLPGSYLQYTTPFASENAVLIDRFLRAIPEYYGVFTTDRDIDVTQLTSIMKDADLSVSGMSMQGTGAALEVFEGVELNNPVTQAMKTQWQILILLVITLAFIFSLSTIMIHSSRSVLFQQELRTFHVLGARFQDILKSSAVASAIQLLIIAILSIFLLLTLYTATLEYFGFLEFSATVTSFDLFKYWLSAFCLVTAIFIFCTLLPITALKNRMLFSRMVGTIRSKTQLMLGQVNLIIQITVALVALNFSFSLINNQLSSFHSLGFKPETLTFEINRQGGTLPLQTMEKAAATHNNPIEIAFSTRPFNDAVTVANEQISDQAPPQIDVHYVTANYFDVLQANILKLDEPWRFGVVINKAAANQLAPDQEVAALIGRPIELGKIMGRQTIIGIVDDLAHTGRFSGRKPTAYVLVKNDTHSDVNTAYLSAGPTRHQIQEAQQMLAATLVTPNFSTTKQLGEVVWSYEQRNMNLVFFSILLVLTISFSIFVNLSYQVKMRLALEQHQYGLLRAIGAPNSSLLMRGFRQPILALAISTLLATCLFAGIKLIIEQSSFAIQPSVIGALLAVGLLSIIILLAVIRPMMKLIRKPISELLKNA
ncbi:hypothetical protein SAMN04488070_1263 [Pseudidiomarina maritima]|uniref:Uncharacterized protein n=1 Tax=Pseudidiomarina maritima TaxID=519453 RepID=A0A1I6GV74_9GAMM|nr:hypothetical protein SAMN04488070_1263 [Pseudidiomarina maritima]